MTAAPASRDRIDAIVRDIVGSEVVAIHSARCGGNNRVYRLDTGDGRRLALKFYPSGPAENRDRLGQEFEALTFLVNCGETRVPKPVGFDRAAGCAVYEWIAGARPGQASAGDLDQLVSFLLDLQKLRRRPDAAVIRPASASYFSPAAAGAQFEARLERLRETAGERRDLAHLLGELAASGRRSVARIEEACARAGRDPRDELPPSMRALSPSDFGLHNTLRRDSGALAFVDFEYFGWDDPVKMLCDLQLHPGSSFSRPAQHRLFNALAPAFAAADPAFVFRYKLLYALEGIMWCLIILNELLPERAARHTMMGKAGDADAGHDRQIAKARDFYRALMETEHELAAG
jgi:hypothetical protein